MQKVFSYGLLVLLLVACGQRNRKDDKNLSVANPDPDWKPYVLEDSSQIDTLKSGLKIYTVRKGPGVYAESGTNVMINYCGVTEGGTEFGNTFKTGEPFNFRVGMKQVIEGMEEGISHLRYGSRAILIVPSKLGYGEKGQEPNIPPNSTLIFHVEVLGSF